jgi:hypothetical protein
MIWTLLIKSLPCSLSFSLPIRIILSCSPGSVLLQATDQLAQWQRHLPCLLYLSILVQNFWCHAISARHTRVPRSAWPSVCLMISVSRRR